VASVDIAQLNRWIGHTIEVADVITPRLVESYRATFAAHLVKTAAGRVPLGLHWCLAPSLLPISKLGPDGHPAAGGFLPPPPLPRRMWAGGAIEFFAALRIGDEVVRRSTIASVDAKHGRTDPLYVIEVQHELSVRGTLVIRERQDIIYRAAMKDTHAARQHETVVAPIDGSRNPTLLWDVECSPVLLFRYSALTFNSHRIHYDLPYATSVEGYGGLLVHGPLQATLLLNIAASLFRGCPARFTYRAVAPLVAARSFKVVAWRENEDHVASRVHDQHGGITCEAAAAR